MQLDLALFLRLSRTLEGTRATGESPLDEHLDILRALDRLFLTVSERMELLRTGEMAAPDEVGIEVEEFEEVPEAIPEVEVEVAEEAPPPPVWTAQHDLLYEDVLWLFKVGDNEGALISLGRLLHVAGDTPELLRFMDINEKKLVGLYERLLGSFQLPLTVSSNGLGDRYFWNVEEAHAVLKRAREAGSVSGLLEASDMPTMKTLALVHRMHLEGLVTLQQS
jgi:hypothetical protein